MQLVNTNHKLTNRDQTFLARKTLQFPFQDAQTSGFITILEIKHNFDGWECFGKEEATPLPAFKCQPPIEITIAHWKICWLTLFSKKFAQWNLQTLYRLLMILIHQAKRTISPPSLITRIKLLCFLQFHANFCSQLGASRTLLQE